MHEKVFSFLSHGNTCMNFGLVVKCHDNWMQYSWIINGSGTALVTFKKLCLNFMISIDIIIKLNKPLKYIERNLRYARIYENIVKSKCPAANMASCFPFYKSVWDFIIWKDLIYLATDCQSSRNKPAN